MNNTSLHPKIDHGKYGMQTCQVVRVRLLGNVKVLGRSRKKDWAGGGASKSVFQVLGEALGRQGEFPYLIPKPKASRLLTHSRYRIFVLFCQ